MGVVQIETFIKLDITHMNYGTKPQNITNGVIRMEKNKIGILKYIAASGAKGVKFEDQPETWYNPATDEAKEMVKEEYKGKQVEIMLVQGKKTEFSSMVLLEAGEEEAVEVEDIEDEQIIDGEDPEEPDPKVLEEDEAKSQEKEEGPCHVPENGEDMSDMKYGPEDGLGPKALLGMLGKMKDEMDRDKYDKKTFQEMEQLKVETAVKGPMKLTYASWAEVWSKLKSLHPTATYHVHEDEKTGMPYINDDKMGAFVKVSVKVKGITHTVHLPVMTNKNQAAKDTELDVMLINKNIQRCFAKAIAMHGIGLKVFKGEDYPEDTQIKKK